MQETVCLIPGSGRSPGGGHGPATHSSVPAWTMPWTEEPGGLQSRVSQRVGHGWATEHITGHGKSFSRALQRSGSSWSSLCEFPMFPAATCFFNVVAVVYTIPRNVWRHPSLCSPAVCTRTWCRQADGWEDYYLTVSIGMPHFLVETFSQACVLMICISLLWIISWDHLPILLLNCSYLVTDFLIL